MSSEFSTHKTIKARFLPEREPFSSKGLEFILIEVVTAIRSGGSRTRLDRRQSKGHDRAVDVALDGLVEEGGVVESA